MQGTLLKQFDLLAYVTNVIAHALRSMHACICICPILAALPFCKPFCMNVQAQAHAAVTCYMHALIETITV